MMKTIKLKNINLQFPLYLTLVRFFYVACFEIDVSLLLKKFIPLSLTSSMEYLFQDKIYEESQIINKIILLL